VIEYIVFFGIVAAGIVFYILYELKPKDPPVILEPERHKCESPIERQLYDALKAHGEFVKTQVRCGKYRIDLALPAYNIAIECDGKAYHSSKTQKIHDREKNEYLKANGWKVLRFTGKRIYKDIRGVIQRIEDAKRMNI
jgi:very-short-patch-repair endonuclease